MKKFEIIISVVFIALLAIIFLGAGPVDNAINSAFNPVDKSCKVASDCDWQSPDCTAPCGWVPANKNWHALCPIPIKVQMEVLCMGPAPGEMRCLNNICNYITNKDDLAKAVPVFACTQDSDCVMTGSGACGGEACPIAINKNYKIIWESTPNSAEQEKNCAVVGMCVPSGMENYIAKCVDNACGVLPKT